MPRARSSRSTTPGSGPPSTSIRAPGGASTSSASPWPTSNAVSVRSAGAAGARETGKIASATAATATAAARRGIHRPTKTANPRTNAAAAAPRSISRSAGAMRRPSANCSPAHRINPSGGPATHATAPPTGIDSCAVKAATPPTTDATVAAGTATRFAAIEANGTAPSRRSSSGATPSCAPTLAAASRRSGRGPGRRRASGGAMTSTPAVASTDKPNPSCPAIAGSASSKTSTATASVYDGSGPRPSIPAASTSAAIALARSTEGSARVSSANQHTATNPIHRRPRAPTPTTRASPSTPARNSATLDPDTATRCDNPASVS